MSVLVNASMPDLNSCFVSFFFALFVEFHHSTRTTELTVRIYHHYKYVPVLVGCSPNGSPDDLHSGPDKFITLNIGNRETLR